MIKKLIIDDKEYILIGTAHISEASLVEVKETIDAEQPDAVAVELCQGRYDNIFNKNRFVDLDITRVIRNGQSLFVLGNILLSSYQKRIGNSLGIKPGAEMIAGIEGAKEIEATLILADRPIDITLKRVIRQLKLRDKFNAILSILEFIFSKDEGNLNVDIIENLKEDSIILDSINYMGIKFPNIKKYLLDERDSYLAYKIKNSPCQKIVAVLGAAHLKGVYEHLKNNDVSLEDIKEKSVVPEKKKYIGYIAALLLILFLVLIILIFNYDPAIGAKSIFFWICLTSSLAALGAYIARGHPFTILSSIFFAPIGAALPFISTGMIVALVEAKIRKPKFKDLSRITEDIFKISRWRKNNLLRVFVVFILTSIGTTVGNLIGLKNILSIFFSIKIG